MIYSPPSSKKCILKVLNASESEEGKRKSSVLCSCMCSHCNPVDIASLVLAKMCHAQKHQPIFFIQGCGSSSYINGTNPETAHSVSHEYQNETIIVAAIRALTLSLLFNDKIEVATVVLRVED